MMLLSDAVEFRLKDLLPELRLELLASLFIQLRSGWLVLRELLPIVRDLFGKGLYDPMELIALEALLEDRKYSDPLPKKNVKRSTCRFWPRLHPKDPSHTQQPVAKQSRSDGIREPGVELGCDDFQKRPSQAQPQVHWKVYKVAE